jgi:UTP:GlnB (protein PII) uridylyltransferase
VAEATALLGARTPGGSRIATAEPGYLLAHSSSDIVRHCELLEPLPAPGEVSVAATPGRGFGEWNLDIVSRDRPGLLAAFTGVLADAEVDVARAVLATWDDGGALQALVVRWGEPGVGDLQRAFEASLSEPWASPAVPDAHVHFGHDASPLYTTCDVTTADRPGLLHALAVAIAAAGADIHAACVTTRDGTARDRFDLSAEGRKLDPPRETAIRVGIRDGVAPLRAARRLR